MAFTLRMDFVESAKSQWSGRYSWGDENQASTGISITGSKILTNYEQYLGTNTRTLTPHAGERSPLRLYPAQQFAWHIFGV